MYPPVFGVWLLDYRILPNKGAGRSRKVRSDRLREKLTFLAFQRWFRIENRTVIKETRPNLGIYDSIGFLQTKRAPLLGEAPLIGRLRYDQVLGFQDLKHKLKVL